MSTILKIFTFFFLAATVTATAQKITPNKLPGDPGTPPPVTPIDDEQIIRVDTATSPEVRAMLELMKNKDKYIGKPFSVLIKDLPSKISKFVNAVPMRWNDPYIGISFSFSSSSEILLEIESNSLSSTNSLMLSNFSIHCLFSFVFRFLIAIEFSLLIADLNLSIKSFA